MGFDCGAVCYSAAQMQKWTTADNHGNACQWYVRIGLKGGIQSSDN